MIKKIHLLKEFGVFKAFEWNDLPELKAKNIFYGWNYSGKTTLSRVFTSLKDKTISTNFSDCDLKITLDDNTEINKGNIATNNLDLLIFNSDYIKKNLCWDTDDEIKGITFDVGENVEFREQIELLKAKIDKVNGTEELRSLKEPFETTISEFTTLENQKFTNEARNIKNNIFNSLIEFNKGHLKTVKNQIISDLETHLISDEDDLNKVKKTALSSNDKEPIEKVNHSSKLKVLYDETFNKVAKEPKKKDVIEFLDSNPRISNWVEYGIPLHQHTENCHFCNNKINDERIIQLNNYFSNESSVLRNSINELISKIDKEILDLENINFPKSKFDFFDNFQEDYETKLSDYTTIQKRIITEYDYLKRCLKTKLNENIFVAHSIKGFEEDLNSDFIQSFSRINEIIISHNEFKENFTTKQEEARKKLKEHQVATFLIDEDYVTKINLKDFAVRCIEKYDNYLTKVDSEILRLEAELKSVVKGQEELNSFIQKFLNRSDIRMEVVNDDKFVLKRGNRIADNFSEGEKTAISFSYFLVTLESLFRDGKLLNYIIFIDDPISSLDGNHIAQVYSLINSFFFRQNLNPDNPEQYVNCFKQLFLSTHNFQFFTFLKDSSRLNKRNTKEYYFIKRISETESTIQVLPKSLRDYKSEYIYLFDIIYSFYDSGCQEDDEKFILMPNAIRRFLEIYTLFKLPDSTAEVDARLKILMPEPTQLKLLHHFSHFTTFEKIMTHDEILLNLPQALTELITLMEQDELHLSSLKRAIGR